MVVLVISIVKMVKVLGESVRRMRNGSLDGKIVDTIYRRQPHY